MADIKTPTASGISRLLAKAGFERSVRKVRNGRSGFLVTKDRARTGQVRVRYYSWMNMGTPYGTCRERIAAYARAITEAGWTVEAGEYELIVTAGKAGQ